MINFIRFSIRTITTISLLFCTVSIAVAYTNSISKEENIPLEIQEKTWNLVYLIDNNTSDSIEYPQGFDKIWIRFTSDSVYVHGFCPTAGTVYNTHPNDSIAIGSIPIQETCGEPYFSPDWNREVAANLTQSFMYNVKDDWLTIYTTGRYSLVFAMPHIPSGLMNKEWSIVYFIENSTSDTLTYSEDLENIRLNFTMDSVFVHGFCPATGSRYEVSDNNNITIDSIHIQDACNVPYTAPPAWDHDLASGLFHADTYELINEWLVVHTNGTYSFILTYSETTRTITNKHWILDAFIKQSTGDTVLYPDNEKKINLTIGIDSVFIHGLCSTVGAPFVRQNFDIVYVEPMSIDKTCGSSAELLQWNEDLANHLLGFNFVEPKWEHWLSISSGEYISIYKSGEVVGIHSEVAGEPAIKLHQNAPNPFSDQTEIRLFIPGYVEDAMIHISTFHGVRVASIPILKRGDVKINFTSAGLQPGVYFCSLVINADIIDSKRMLLIPDL